MWLPTKSQVDAASRHLITAAGVAVTIFGLQAKGVSTENVTALINSLGNTVNTMVQLAAAIGVVYGAIQASRSASPTAQIEQVKKDAVSGSQDAKVALLDATASVLSSPATAPATAEVKSALLDATAAMPEVVGQITVTDPALVTGTRSEQIVKTEGMSN